MKERKEEEEEKNIKNSWLGFMNEHEYSIIEDQTRMSITSDTGREESFEKPTKQDSFNSSPFPNKLQK